MRATWKPHEKHGELTGRSDLPDSVFAYPKERKEPMTDASHVRNAIARFDQVTDVSDDERATVSANIKKAAKHYKVVLSESNWHELGSRPATAQEVDHGEGRAQEVGREEEDDAQDRTEEVLISARTLQQ